ncbi:hypothetical protein [Pseudonocardia sp.]|uniref:hypothetical protein n=1 Tax=Pseudonocardia sp. TaxID=60912 RepID=UPI003D0C8F16
MNTFVMASADDHVLLHHLAFYGLADILDTAGAASVRLTWDATRPTLTADALDENIIEQAVRNHITARRRWVDEQFGPDRRGLMSPRLSAINSDGAWRDLQSRREAVLDRLTNDHEWADLRFLAALGEPCYWSHPRGEPRPDHGASRLEMQPRNRGSEFVGNRLRPLATALLARAPGQISSGLAGRTTADEIGGKPDSVSATGLTTPGPVDNALVWCALWAIGQFPLTVRIDRPAVNSGHLGGRRNEWLYGPVWEGPWRPGRLRSILASAPLRTAATAGQPNVDALALRSAQSWLRVRGVLGIARFPIQRFGSDNAPERRALRADMLPTAL